MLLAPGYDDEAVAALRAKRALRILSDTERRAETPGERDFKRVLGGLLVQERDADIEDREAMEVVTGEVTRRSGAISSSPGACASTFVERDRDREGPADDRDRRRAR